MFHLKSEGWQGLLSSTALMTVLISLARHSISAATTSEIPETCQECLLRVCAVRRRRVPVGASSTRRTLRRKRLDPLWR